MLPQNRRQCVRAVSFLFFFSLLRHGSDSAWNNVLNIVPFRPGRNVNTENHTLRVKSWGRREMGEKNKRASKDTISTDSSIETHHTHKPEVDVLKKQRKKNASSEQTSMCPSGVFSFLFFTSPTRRGLMF